MKLGSEQHVFEVEVDTHDGALWLTEEYAPYPVCWLEFEHGIQVLAQYKEGAWWTVEGAEGHKKVKSPECIKSWSPHSIIGVKKNE